MFTPLGVYSRNHYDQVHASVVVNADAFLMMELRCRQIGEADIEAVATLFARGFPAHNRQFWLRGFAQLTRHQPPPGLPQYGYLLENAGVVVGAILLICSAMRSGDATETRCNLSSWYVEPPFRAYAPMLVSKALRYKDVTYTNISPAPHTLPIIEAQGFSRYSDGIFIAIPALSRLFGATPVKVFEPDRLPDVAFDPFEQQLLVHHRACGCICLWCATSERAYPFVFQPRHIRAGIAFAQLIYSREIGDFVRFAGPIGRALARRGRLFVIVDANAPIPGLLGWFSRGKLPKYFKGPRPPRLGDLAYTEHVMPGV